MAGERRFLGTLPSPALMAWGPLTIDLGIAAALIGFLSVGLLAVADRRNGQVGILGLALLIVGLLLAVTAAVTVQF